MGSMTQAMPENVRRVLVVGAGLTGAALAWLAARRGLEVELVSVGRPTSEATALAPGVVHGFGLAGEPGVWTRMTAPELRHAAERLSTGTRLVREAIFRVRRPVGYTRIPHVRIADHAASSALLEAARDVLVGLGLPVRLTREHDDAALVREHDAMVNRRRMTMELLRLARDGGARLRLHESVRRVRRRGDGIVEAERTDGSALYDRVFWAGMFPYKEDPAQSAYRNRAILHQLCEPGPRPLERILETATGDVMMAPESKGSRRVVVVRIADEAPGEGLLHWPELPGSFEELRGEVLRQRLTTGVSCPARRSFRGDAPFVSMTGLTSWSVTSLLGACQEVVGEAESPTETRGF
jgi:glycine/D-amino acid oxidase-like deaminating enzyme